MLEIKQSPLKSQSIRINKKASECLTQGQKSDGRQQNVPKREKREQSSPNQRQA